MRKNRPISLCLVVALLLSLFAPLGATEGHCAGSDAVRESLESSKNSHEHAAPHDHAAGHDANHGDAGHHEAGHHDSSHHRKAASVDSRDGDSGTPNRFSYCCIEGLGTTAPAGVEVPTLTPVQSLRTVILLVSHFHQFLPTNLDQIGPDLSSYKIGSSPPTQAVADQHTYLRTSVLLI